YHGGSLSTHVAKPVKTYLETLKWEVLPHPLYSPDIAPSDYHLFRSLAHSLCEQKFTSYEDCTKWFDSWISSKDEQFFRRGIHSLPERWSKGIFTTSALAEYDAVSWLGTMSSSSASADEIYEIKVTSRYNGNLRRFNDSRYVVHDHLRRYRKSSTWAHRSL
ncbi:MOS1T transposase, partial [Pseudoatta argentina]